MKKVVAPIAIVLIAASSFGYFRYQRSKVDRASKARLEKILSYAPNFGSKPRNLIPLWTFPLGHVKVGQTNIVSSDNPFPESELPEMYKHFRDRQKYLRQLRNDWIEVGGSFSVNFQGKTKRSVYFTTFCVVVTPVTVNGRTKYRAVDVESGGGFQAAEVDQLIQAPRTKVLAREDLINPEDVDWLLDVRDFTQVIAGTSSVL